MNQDNPILNVEERAKALRRASARAYYQKNRAEILKRRRLKRQENLPEELEKERKYRAQNPEKIKKWNENYWKRRAEKEIKKDA